MHCRVRDPGWPSLRAHGAMDVTVSRALPTQRASKGLCVLGARRLLVQFRRSLASLSLSGWVMVLAACGGGDGHVADGAGIGSTPIQDKAWSAPFGLAHDSTISAIAFNASGPVALAWWHRERVPAGDLPSNVVSETCALRTRRWRSTREWRPIETLVEPSPSASFRCGEVGVQANSMGDVLVVAHPSSSTSAVLFRRLATDTVWTNPGGTADVDPGWRSATIARLGEGGVVRQIDFRFRVRDAVVAPESYHYVARVWDRSGLVRQGPSIDVSYRDPSIGYRVIYAQAVSIDPSGNALAVFDAGNRLRWSRFREDIGAWSAPAVLASSTEGLPADASDEGTGAFRLGGDPLGGKPWLFVTNPPSGTASRVETRAWQFDPTLGWRASEHSVLGPYLAGWHAGSLATLPDGRAMLIYLDLASASDPILMERRWLPNAGWTAPRRIASGPRVGYDARAAIAATGQALAAYRDCAWRQQPAPMTFDTAGRLSCVVKVARLHDIDSPVAQWSAPEDGSPRIDASITSPSSG